MANLPKPVETHALELYLFDLNLRALVMKAMSIVEIALENQVNAKPSNENFGSLRRKVETLSPLEQFKLATHFGYSTPRELRVAMRNCNALRNRAAHHEPIWRRRLHIGASKLRKPSSYLVKEKYVDLYSPAASLSVLTQALGELPFLFDFQNEFHDLVNKSSIDKFFILKNMGFEVFEVIG